MVSVRQLNFSFEVIDRLLINWEYSVIFYIAPDVMCK